MAPIGTRIKSLRLKAGLTQVQLAQASGLTQSNLACIENNTRVPAATRLYSVAKALGVQMEDLLTEDTSPRGAPSLIEADDRRVHGNSAAALVQKILLALDEDGQKELLHQARLIERAHKPRPTRKRVA